MRTAKPIDGTLTVRLLGPLEVRVGGQPLPPVRSRKILWILALLVLRAGRPVDREWLARTLWPEADLTQALANLRPALSQLRTALGAEAGRLFTPDRRTLMFDLGGAFADVVAFDKAVSSSRSADLEAAADLYRGPFLEGCTEEWVYQERESRERACLEGLLRLGESAARRGDFAAAANWYRRAVAISGLADAPRRGLIDALARGGDRNGALEAYRQFTDHLRAEIGAEPDEATSRLYLELRRQIRQEGRGPVSNGEVPKLAGQLPHPLANLVGREEERIEVATEIRRGRLVTLVGPGGIGKTRLAIESARDVAREFPDGTWLVALEALSSEDLLERQVASVLGLREEVGQPLANALIGLFQSKRLLLVLDNCEHLLRASARFADWLLRECGGVKILATSRESLGISGERIWAVPSLPYPNLDHLPASSTTRRRVLAGYESVELFVERATAAQRDFTLNSGNATAVAQICARLEGMPLAIELAAARASAMKVEEIARRLEEGVGLLSGGKNLPARQRTLRATLDWSYELLEEKERRILRRLSIFTGGWTLEAAERVVVDEEIADGEVLDLLRSLVDKSLVWFEETRGRYRLSEPVRQYAAEMRQASDDSERMKQAHTDWCIDYAETGDRNLRRRDHRLWMGRLADERDNLRSALTRTRGTAAGLRLAYSLCRFWLTGGEYAEGCGFLDEALRKASDAPDALRAQALGGLGGLYLVQSDYVKAKECFQAGLELGDFRDLSRLAKVAHEQGDDDQASRLAEQGLAAARLEDDLEEIANCLIIQLEVAVARSGGTEGTEIVTEALIIYRELEDEIGIATCLHQLAYLRRFDQEHLVTEIQYREALELFKILGDRSAIAMIYYSLGQHASNAGAFLEAAAHWSEALDLYRSLGDRRGVVLAQAFLGMAKAMAGELDEATELTCQSLSLTRHLPGEGGEINSVECLAVVLMGLNRYALATQCLAYSSFQREKIGSKRGPLNLKLYNQRLVTLRSSLGDAAFDREWKEGEALNVEKILLLVLQTSH